MEITNKIIVITGGSKGLGKSLASVFSQAGAKVIIASRNADELQKVAEETGATMIQCDVRQESEILKLAREVVHKFGQIDFWINNAGVWIPPTPIEALDWEKVHNLFEVNVFGTMYGSKAALLQMKKQNSGCIINIISTSGLEANANSSTYGASKFAVRGFTQAMTKEVEGTKIKIMAVYPGGMQTNFFDEKKPTNFSDYMHPQDIANKILQSVILDEPGCELILKRPKQ